VDFYFLGDEELVTAFRFIGIEGMPVKDSNEAVAAFRRITEGFNETAGIALPDSLPGADTCQILIMTEETADWIESYMINWQISGRYPLLVEIPGIGGRLPGRKTLVDSIREAIGIHV
jgi:V/A-type H+-transporting ATPase subunit F